MKQSEIDKMSIIDRAVAPMPKFFRILKFIGLALAAVSGVILAAPVAYCPLKSKMMKKILAFLFGERALAKK